jgi:hypothetical protein
MGRRKRGQEEGDESASLHVNKGAIQAVCGPGEGGEQEWEVS